MYSVRGGGGGGWSGGTCRRIPVIVVNIINRQGRPLFYVKVCMVCRVGELLEFYIVP